jgi:hypothetical protein
MGRGNMPTVELGSLTLHTNDIGWLPGEAPSFSGGKVQGQSYPATVTSPDGLEIDLALFMADDGEGMVHCPDAAGVPPDYARLAHGARLGVYVEDDDAWIIKQLRLLSFSREKGWGNPKQTTIDELDDLLDSSTELLLVDLGVEDIGPKNELLGTRGNDLAARWSPESGPEVPMALYVLTRILPIYKALSA